MERLFSAFQLLLKDGYVSIKSFSKHDIFNLSFILDFTRTLVSLGFVQDNKNGNFMLCVSKNKVEEYMKSKDIEIVRYSSNALSKKLDKLEAEAIFVYSELFIHENGMSFEELAALGDKDLQAHLDSLQEQGLVKFNKDKQRYFNRLDRDGFFELINMLQGRLVEEYKLLIAGASEKMSEKRRTKIYERLQAIKPQLTLIRKQKDEAQRFLLKLEGVEIGTPFFDDDEEFDIHDYSTYENEDRHYVEDDEDDDEDFFDDDEDFLSDDDDDLFDEEEDENDDDDDNEDDDEDDDETLEEKKLRIRKLVGNFFNDLNIVVDDDEDDGDSEDNDKKLEERNRRIQEMVDEFMDGLNIDDDEDDDDNDDDEDDEDDN